MSRSIARRWAAAAVAAATAGGVGLTIVASGGTALAGAASVAAGGPVVTRAGLNPSLVAGRGASVAFAEQEAENAATNGTIIGPDRTAYTLPAEASGRTAVRLTPGHHVEFRLPSA